MLNKKAKKAKIKYWGRNLLVCLAMLVVLILLCVVVGNIQWREISIEVFSAGKLIYSIKISSAIIISSTLFSLAVVTFYELAVRYNNVYKKEMLLAFFEEENELSLKSAILNPSKKYYLAKGDHKDLRLQIVQGEEKIEDIPIDYPTLAKYFEPIEIVVGKKVIEV